MRRTNDYTRLIANVARSWRATEAEESWTEPEEVRVSYATFRELWKRLVSKRKARKLEVDRDEIWQRLASGQLDLREHTVVLAKAAIDEGTTAAASLDEAGQIRIRSTKRHIPVVAVNEPTRRDRVKAGAADAVQTPGAVVQRAKRSRGVSVGDVTLVKPRAKPALKKAVARTNLGGTPIKRRCTRRA